MKVPQTLLTGFGAWVSGVVFARAFPWLFENPSPQAQAALYGATIPASWVLLKSTQLTGAFERHETQPAVALMTALALIIDGTVLTWFGQVYARTKEAQRRTASWLLFAAGLGLALPFALGDKL
eukprot:TRINITY_DN3446_c0_g1_i1.p2 TRINITY_DN3446_c0_g1~~TRINITY_DN3446_c0_g1_i1.p2  ORF type:complete len:124 (-),score=25.93 TRINITY_DN3446_c0_g1_i1:262-633(-)